ncbi:MAG: hypothetical protein HDR17_14240 [Lachnospiraceae bacterium]|nr:hypothetical protein [Lachnospiraceae bacterium]
MKQVKNNYSKYLEAAGMLLFFAIVVFGILCATGTLTSGIHMVDDHELLEWSYDMRIEGTSLVMMIEKVVQEDSSIRFRPLYIALRILEAYVFGSDMLVFSIINAIEIIGTMLFLYYCGRVMGAGKLSSVLFALVSLMGYQSVVWWKLGPQESFGCMLFAIGFYFMLKWLYNGRISGGIISLVIFFLMCNYKESFIMLLPFCGLYVIYSVTENKNKLSEFNDIFIRLKGKYWYIVGLAGIFIYAIIAILLVVGLTSYGGFDVKESLSVREYLSVLANSFNGDLKWYKWFTLLFIAILLTFWDELKKLWKEWLLLFAFLAPQFALYAQTGIAERYMLPSTIGYAWFFIVVILKWKPLTGKRKMVYAAGLILLILANARGMIIEADYFRYRGESVTRMLETVERLSDENDIKILSCFRPNEEGNLTVYYWQLLEGHDNVYYWTEASQEINRVCDINIHYDPNDTEVFEIHDLNEIDVILMYNQNDRHYCYEPSLDASDFEIFDIGSMTMWIRKGRISIPQIPDVKNYIYG